MFLRPSTNTLLFITNVFLLLLFITITTTQPHPPGPGPFTQEYLPQPVKGAPRGESPYGWKEGKLCDVTQPPYNAIGDGKTNNTLALRQAIEDCGDLPEGGTVLLPAHSGTFLTASLWLKSNLTFRVELGATLLSTTSVDDAIIVYCRRSSLMTFAHAGLLNGARCLEMKKIKTGGDDCKTWGKLENVVLEGRGLLDANGAHWYLNNETNNHMRPIMLDLMWIDGLTIRDLAVRRPGFWTIHPCFSNNVVVTGVDVYTRGHNTDGIDPDSTWNMYIANSRWNTGDDCVAIKAGRDLNGQQVNISSQNILIENNEFHQGHGVSMGSETSGWITNVTLINNSLHNITEGARMKTCPGRGGGIQHILYQNLTGVVARTAVEMNLLYNECNSDNDALVSINHIELKNLAIRLYNMNPSKSMQYLICQGLEDSIIKDIKMENSYFKGGNQAPTCSFCLGTSENTKPKPCFDHPF